MELKNTLKKPYTNIEKADFIVANNHTLGYEIRETETELQAWGYDSEELLQQAKQSKIAENDAKAEEYRYNQEFTVTIQGKECVFDTKEKTQNDLNTATNFCLATGGTYDNWTTNNGVVLNLTIEDINIIFEEFKAKADVYTKWLEYDTAIKKAETIEQLEEIDISYDRVDN